MGSDIVGLVLIRLDAVAAPTPKDPTDLMVPAVDV